MQHFKIYEDTENVYPTKKPRIERNKKRVLGEIKNVIVTRSKASLNLTNGVELTKNDKNQTFERKRPIQKKAQLRIKSAKVTTEDNIKATKKQSLEKRLSSVFKVSDYACDIFRYLRYLEIKYEIVENPNTRLKFKEGTRIALLDWFVEMHEYVQMTPDTFQLSVSIMDRYLQLDDTIQKKELQLVALSSAFISSKYEEISPIEISDLMYVSDNAYSVKDIYEMEIKILCTLGYSFGRPVTTTFIRRYCCVSNATKTEQSLAMYFSEVALLSYDLCYVRPSIIAAAAFYMALCISKEKINRNFWDANLIYHSTYRLHEFAKVVTILADLVMRLSMSKYEAIKRKYSLSSYQCVSLLPNLDPEIGIINRLVKDFE